MFIYDAYQILFSTLSCSQGVVPTAQRAAVIAGVLLPSYDFFKQSLLEYGVMGDTVSTHFVAGFLAGVLGTAASNPVDVVKSRMMNQAVLKNSSANAGHVYTGSINCFVTVCQSSVKVCNLTSLLDLFPLRHFVLRVLQHFIKDLYPPT